MHAHNLRTMRAAAVPIPNPNWTVKTAWKHLLSGRFDWLFLFPLPNFPPLSKESPFWGKRNAITLKTYL